MSLKDTAIKRSRWWMSRRSLFLFSFLEDVGLDEVGKTEASSLLLADAADRRNAGLTRLLCLFVDLKDSRLVVKHTITLG